MKKFSIFLLLSFTISSAYAFELEYIYLKNGIVIDAQRDIYDIPINKVDAIKIKDENNNDSILKFNSDNTLKEIEFFQNYHATRMGGDGTGGGGGG